MAKGDVNTYTCSVGHVTVTVDRDPGTTPFLIHCQADGCPCTATSACYGLHGVIPPARFATHEFYRPGDDELPSLMSWQRNLVDRGILLLRKIEPAPESSLSRPAWSFRTLWARLVGA